MATRPTGSPAAPPRRPAREAGELDALSVVLGVPADESDRSADSPSLVRARILDVLKESGRPLQLNEVARSVPYDFFSLSTGLVVLAQQGMINVEGSPGSEVVSLRSPER
jgi:predicted transcriptional regulator